MKTTVWFDADDALHELIRLSQVKSLFMDKAWEEAFFARDRWKEFASEESLELSEDDLNDLSRSKAIEVEMLKQAYLRSHLVMAYGIFEKGLLSLALQAHRALGLGDPPNRKQSSVLNYARDMLRNRCKVTGTFGSEDWDKVNRVREIRNVVAHGASLLEDESDLQKFPNWTKSFLGISKRPFGGENSQLSQIWLEPYFVGYTHQIFRSVLSGAMAELGDPLEC